jgi:hypothetical protein
MTFGAGRSHGACQLEIDLPLERVDFGHLDLQPVAQLKNAACPPANQVAAVRVELVEVIAQAG